MNSSLPNFLDVFTEVCRKPHNFLSVQEKLAEDVKDLLKQMYDYLKSNEESCYKSTLPNLIVESFDDEQIWQELELQNVNFRNDIIQTLPKLSANEDKLKFPVKLKCNKPLKESLNQESSTEQTNDDERIEEEEEEEMEEDFAREDEDNESNLSEDSASELNLNNIEKKRKLKPSIVDDKFFKLSELELFLQNEERNQNNSNEQKESIDLFDDSDVGPANYKYSDFFENPENEASVNNENEGMEEDDATEDDDSDQEKEDKVKPSENTTKKKYTEEMDVDGENDDNFSDEHIYDDKTSINKEKHGLEKKKKKVKFSLLESEESDDESSESPALLKQSDKKSNKIKSSFEERQERLGQVIENLEEEALSEKPWQLKGEVSANARPENSLLEEEVDFDLSVRPVPVISDAVEMRLEDIIAQRIKDKAWDDVERKVKPVDTPSEFKKRLALDQEKSKLSLAEVYEQEFIKQREAATVDDTERQETEPALHVEVRSMLSSLFNKLDALSNYHYTPRPVVPELKVVSNIPAINMEEVAPISVADSALLAPQEIKGKKRRGELMSKEERSETDKKRARRLKKAKQRQRQREKARAAKEVTKINPGLGNKYSKIKAIKEITNASSNNVTKMEESKEKVIKSSTSFFNKLQEEVKSQIKSKTSPFAKKKDKRNITAKKLKL